MTNEITISKGSYQVTLYGVNIAENYSNKIFVITPATSIANQSSGGEKSKIVDLLRITHQIVIKGYICGSDTSDSQPAKLNGVAQNLTAKQVKNYLVKIFDGGGISGGTATLTFDPGGSEEESFNGYIEKLTFVEVSEDAPSSSIKDAARYEVALTFAEGIQV